MHEIIKAGHKLHSSDTQDASGSCGPSEVPMTVTNVPVLAESLQVPMDGAECSSKKWKME